MKYTTSDIKNGLKVLIDGEPCIIIENEFEKPGKGQAFTRVKLKHCLTGRVLDRTYKSGQSLLKNCPPLITNERDGKLLQIFL